MEFCKRHSSREFSFANIATNVSDNNKIQFSLSKTGNLCFTDFGRTILFKKLNFLLFVKFPIASHADVLRSSSRVPAPRDEPLRTSAWEASWSITSIARNADLILNNIVNARATYV